MREENQVAEQGALKALKLGQHRVALRMHQALLNESSGDSAWHHLQISMIYGLLNEPKAQDKHVEIAAKIAPSNPSVLLDYGSYCFRNGNLSGARIHFEKATDDPHVGSQALSNLAAIKLLEGDEETANEFLDQSLHINPQNSHAIDLKLKALEGNVSHFDSVDILLSQHPSANPSLVLTLKGIQLNKAESAAAALECFDKAIEIDPGLISPQLEKAKILSQLGRSDEAIEQLLVSLTIEPDHIDLMLRMGYCLQQVQQVDSAVYFYERILKIEEIHSEASNLLGCCYRFTGRDEESIPIFTEALKHDSDNCKLLGNLASALRNVGRVQESLAFSRKILSLNPLSPEGFYSFMFTKSILPRREQADMLSVAREYWSSYRETLLADHDIWNMLEYKYSTPNLSESRKLNTLAAGKIKVGILSAEIGAHVVGMFLRSFLTYYNRTDFHVCLITFHRRYETQENELVDLADDILSINGLSSLAAATAIREQDFDVIIETSGYTHNTQLHLLAYRLAAVQCHYIGYHSSTGLDTIDYFIADSITAPLDSDDLFAEKVWRLPRTWLAITYHEKLPNAISLSEIEQFVFGSFNQGAKFNLDTFEYWASALNAVRDSVLVVKDRSLASDKRVEWIVASLEAHGIDRSRLRFLGATQSWHEHMAVYNVVDACFDCTSWSGSTTVFDSLSMGTPYIGIRGDTMSARMSSSILNGYGFEQWIARSIDEFSRIALKLSEDVTKIRNEKPIMQQEILSKTCENARVTTKYLEKALKEMTRDYLHP